MKMEAKIGEDRGKGAGKRREKETEKIQKVR